MTDYTERRQTVRINVGGTMNVETVTVGQPLRLVDLGTGGFAARSAAPIPLNTVAAYRFTSSDRKWTAVFRARAVHCKLQASETGALRYVTGFAFVNVESPSSQRLLMAMMDQATDMSFS